MGSKKITSIVVSSDDHDILEIAAEYPSIITVKRPEEISGDHAPAITYILHALEYMETKFIFNYDIIVIVQPSSPFTLGEDIDQTISLLEENKYADSSLSVMK